MEDIRKFSSVVYNAQKIHGDLAKYPKHTTMSGIFKETNLKERNNIFYSLFRKDEVIVEIMGVAIKTKRLESIENNRYVATLNAQQYEHITGEPTDEKESRLVIFNDCSILLTNAKLGSIWIGTEFVTKIRNVGDEICNVCKNFATGSCPCDNCKFQPTDEFAENLLAMQTKKEKRFEILMEAVVEKIKNFGASDKEAETYEKVFRGIYYSK